MNHIYENWYSNDCSKEDLLINLNYEQRLKCMKKVIEVLDDLKIEYIAEGGTLLGAVRHKGFIPWDDDIDLLLYNTEKSTKNDIIALLTPRLDEYSIRDDPELVDYIQITNKENSRNLVDLMMIPYPFIPYGTTSKYFDLGKSSNIHPITKVQFEDTTINIPIKANEYLDVYYPNWNVEGLLYTDRYHHWDNDIKKSNKICHFIQK